uniref:TATA-box-binding protein-like n=1 Tax=Styela clava TaxID=7725 RepID=UPI00193A8B4A|nr:TATA-box-binding protein-like [Styela clava]
MDDLAGPSFFDYTGAHSTISSSTLEIHGAGLDSVLKQETHDSTAWIQGFTDLSSEIGITQQHTSYEQTTSKVNFFQSGLQNPIGLESLISGPPSQTFDSLDLILNEPSSFDNNTSSSIPTSIFSTSVENNNISKVEPITSDSLILNSLNALPTHNSMQQSTHNATIENSESQGPLIPLEKAGNVPNLTVTTVKEIPATVIPKEVDPEKDLNLYITNVVTSFRVRCHLNLRRIAQEGINVIYQRESKKIIMRIRRPSCTAYIWSSGKIICTGANSEMAARKGSRKLAKRLQKIGFQVIFSNFKVINVLAVCKMPYHINIVDFSNFHRSKHLSYEPEIHPAVTYRMPDMKVTFKIFSTGSITLTCPVVARISEAIKLIYPMVEGFFKKDKPNDLASLRKQPDDFEKVEDKDEQSLS